MTTKIRFKDEFTEDELALHLNRYVKTEHHDEDGNKIVDRDEYEQNIKQTKENFTNRILSENLELFNTGKSPVNPPKLFDGCSMSDFDKDRYPDNFLHDMYERALQKDSFWLMGEYGSGKSRFLWSYAKHLYLELGCREIMVVRWLDLIGDVKLVYGAFEYGELFKKAMSIKTLLVDDIQVMKGNSVREYNAFIDLLNCRLENEATTCFTSNVMFNIIAGDEDQSKRLSSRMKRLLKSRNNVIVFKEEGYDF
jgi:DNA replication protein DnaC